MKYSITLCDVYPNDGEILGHVTPIDNDLEFNKFYDILEKSWLTYVKEVYINDFEDIESFVEWHNENSDIKITSIVNSFIQLY